MRQRLSSNSYVTPSNPSLAATCLASGITPVIRRTLMGYIGFANFPHQVHRKSVRKGFQFTIMVVRFFFSFPVCLGPSSVSSHPGESGLGRTTLIKTLFNAPLYLPKEPSPLSAERPKTESIGAGMSSPPCLALLSL